MSSQRSSLEILKGFEKWQPLPEEHVTQALREGLVVFDANVLLHLYDLEEESLEDWHRIFNKIGDRVWLPHQVMDEFWKNRFTKLPTESSTTGFIGRLQAAKGTVLDVYEKWLDDTKTENADEALDELRSELSDVIGNISNQINASQEQRKQRFDRDPSKDGVVQLLDKIFSRRVGEPFSNSELTKQHAIADARYSEKIPPGFHDDSNNEQAVKGKNSDAKYGDYLLWRQLLDHGKNGSGVASGGLIFITNDGTEDWWRDPFENFDKATRKAQGGWLIPHPLLVEEVQRELGASYIQLKSHEFLESIRTAYKDLKISQRTMDQAAEAEIASSDSKAEEVQRIIDEGLDSHVFVLTKHSEILARARIDDDGKTTTILANSTARKYYSESAPAGVRQAEDLLAQGILGIGEHDDRYKFVQEYTFDSSSTAASVVTGANRSGYDSWKTRTGRNAPSLGEVLSQLNNDDEEEE